MTTKALDALLGPLSFASRRSFAGVEKLRGLEALVRDRTASARAGGEADEGWLLRVEATVRGFDDLDRGGRERAIRALAAVLGERLPLPEGLQALTGGGGSADAKAAPAKGAKAAPAKGAKAAPAKGAAPSRAAPPAASGPNIVPGFGPAALEAGAPVPAGPGIHGGPPGGPAPTAGTVTAAGTAAAGAANVAPAGTAAAPGRDPVLDAPISRLAGVGPGRAGAFAARGVRTLRDALWFLPVSYEQRLRVGRIADLKPGTKATVVGEVETAGERRTGPRRRIFEATVTDGSGRILVRFYRHTGWMARRLSPGARVGLSGPVRDFRGRLEMSHPDVLDPDSVAGEGDAPDEVVPRYGEVEGVPPRTLRGILARALGEVQRLPDPLPAPLREARELLSLPDAVRDLHLPPPDVGLDVLERLATPAQRRLVYDEFFFLQLGLALKARGVRVEAGIGFPVDEGSLGEALSLLPFAPTGAQVRVLREIVADMARAHPMHRLLQGDVGSGKTAVAAVALALAVRSGYQGAVMAPTELLAEQHARTLRQILEPAGIRVSFLSGSLGAADRRAAYAEINAGRAQVAVGTHALIQQGVSFPRLGLVVVDEQHRFGVRQRATLMEKGLRPDTLVMTATPIPRTLAMTAYGDLDLSVLDELPPGRTPVDTRLFRAKDIDRVWARVHAEVKKGHQAYVVYPLVEESEQMEEVKDATAMAEHLGREVFPDLNVGLLHGRMTPAQKDEVMKAFAAGAVHVLVATTVIEVGIDVPNASVMVIDHAERFGLSQLHQLRGRVGRGAAQSHCLLVAEEVRGERVRERLAVMEETTDGFRIAEEDLRIRGPGELLGTRQSGHPDLLFGNLARDRRVLSEARTDAFALLEADPGLSRPEHQEAAREVVARWGGRIRLGRVG